MTIAAHGSQSRAGRRAPPVAWALSGVSVLLGVAGIVLHLLPGRIDAADYGAWWITNSVGAIAIAALGGLVAARRPRNPVGWLLLADALCHGLTAAAREYSLHALAPGSGLPEGVWALWLSGWTYTDFPVLIPLFLLFPDGRLRSRRWLPVLGVGLVVSLAVVLDFMTEPGPMLPPGTARALNPLPWPAVSGFVEGFGTLVLLSLLAALGVGVVSMVLHAREVTGPARRRIVLVALAATILTLELGHEDFMTYAGEEYAGAAVIVLFCASVALAILRYGLYEIDVIVSRTMVYGGLTVVLGGAYVELWRSRGAWSTAA